MHCLLSRSSLKFQLRPAVCSERANAEDRNDCVDTPLVPGTGDRAHAGRISSYSSGAGAVVVDDYACPRRECLLNSDYVQRPQIDVPSALRGGSVAIG